MIVPPPASGPRPAPPPPAQDPGARRRKWVDAARILPYAGLFAVFLPILWAPGNADPPRSTAADGLYLFALWAVLIAAAFVVVRGLDRRGADAGGDAGGDGWAEGAEAASADDGEA